MENTCRRAQRNVTSGTEWDRDMWDEDNVGNMSD